jgi:hypothetical protein
MKVINAPVRRVGVDVMLNSMMTLAMCTKRNSGIGGVRIIGFLLSHPSDRWARLKQESREMITR